VDSVGLHPPLSEFKKMAGGMRWWDIKIVYRILVRKDKGIDNCSELTNMRGLILKRFLKKCDVKVWTGFIWLSLGSAVKMIMNLQVPSKMAFLDEEWTHSKYYSLKKLEYNFVAYVVMVL
jgi:hypothetical protein